MPRGVYDHWKIRKISKVKNWDRYKDLEYYPNRFCACSCGGRIKVQKHHKYSGIPKYIIGHQYRGKRRPNDVIEKIRRSSRKTWQDPELIKRHSEITKLLWEDPEYRRSHCEGLMGHDVTEETRENQSKAQKHNWQDPEYREKRLNVVLEAMRKGRKIKPNKPEKFLFRLLQELFPNQWKFTGSGKFKKYIVAGKIPDFVNINGQKKIIEHFGDYWHSKKKTGRTKEEEEQQRIDVFAKEGYQTLIIWEYELDDVENLIAKLLNFVEEKK